MPRTAFVNGRYQALDQPSILIEDRGYQFADGVYEVIAIAGGRAVDLDPHLARLERSLGALAIPRPLSRPALATILTELVRRNRLDWGRVYLQVTRGTAPRAHHFPAGAQPNLVLTARPIPPPEPGALAPGQRVITRDDPRWKRCDIKSVALLPNVLLKEEARAAGADETWMVDGNGRITEGTSSNAWIVAAGGGLVTRALDNAILGGVTRAAVLALARADGMEIEERGFTAAEARAAPEAFLTSTTAFVQPVVEIDGAAIGDGRPGPIASGLRQRYLARLGVEARP